MENMETLNGGYTMTSKIQYQDRELSKRERLVERKLARRDKATERAYANRAIAQTIKNER